MEAIYTVKMNRSAAVPSTPARPDASFAQAVVEELRVLIVAGIPTGVLVAGIGSRFAMFVLRLTSPGSVRGVESDDGFTIGRFTLSGTYGLLMIGAVVGVIGAGAYQWVRPWLLGPSWFRTFTVGLASASVVGAMLVHADGIDFRLLKPAWLAIALFVALPGLFAISIGLVVDRVERPTSWTRRGRARWLVPAVAVVVFPFVVVILLFATVVLAVWVAARDDERLRRVAAHHTSGVVIRVGWLGVAVVGLLTLLNDIREISAAA